MMRLVSLAITLAVFLVDSSKAEFVCHHWTEEDYNAMPQGRTPEDERQYCEDVLGYVFTQGENEFYPKCGQCWCCKPDGEELLVNEDLVCYHWTEEDNKAMPQGRTAEDEKYYCEDVLGYTFSKGDYVNYPNCGTCWCCRPKVFVCHHWTEEDYKAMPQGRTPEDERQYCEDVLGYTFTQGQNEEYPECGECWCCKPES
ncbi:uncharacterized protein LOC132720892 [Ruditapes philippinarum]|uniref:uncharacterized protein LOC132720892 n=1 Tax=Ruditapes philippinarum TaxID=129788 RepID=UPI00295C02A6|nr:uncharacterized protein LOC132720892 [Ruditapes philippinarum]